MSKKTNLRIGLLTSGGDSAGMNAAIRAVVRTAIYHNIEIWGIERGYNGMIDNHMNPMTSRSVANIIQRGGTILKTARSKDFHTKAGRKKAYQNLKKNGINALVIIGGDGSFKGANFFSQEFDIPCIGIPGTIDNDMEGTDITIGFDTAVNTAIYAIDKIRETADSHDRLFIVEVMGRNSGCIALHSGIATGAENVFIPEKKTDLKKFIYNLHQKEKRKKLVNLLIVAEGNQLGVYDLQKIINKEAKHMEVRICILGHIQRGGPPTCVERVIASRMGNAAINELIKGNKNIMIGIINNKIATTPLSKAVKSKETIEKDWTELAKVLAT